MRAFWICLIVFWVIIIAFPAIREDVVRRLQSAIKKEINDVFEIIWKNENLRTILFKNSKIKKNLWM